MTPARLVTRKERAYAAIKERILSASLPPHDPISESELALDLGVSRTPVREALAALEKDGLVKIIPGKGAFVAGFSLAELEDTFAVREVIEGLAARMAALRLDAGELTDLEAVFQSAGAGQDGAAAVRAAAEELHRLIVVRCGNARVQRLIAQMNDDVRRVRVRSTMVTGRTQRSVEEHLRIIQTLKDRDPAAAEEAMRMHIRSVLQVMRQAETESALC